MSDFVSRCADRLRARLSAGEENVDDLVLRVFLTERTAGERTPDDDAHLVRVIERLLPRAGLETVLAFTPELAADPLLAPTALPLLRAREARIAALAEAHAAVPALPGRRASDPERLVERALAGRADLSAGRIDLLLDEDDPWIDRELAANPEAVFTDRQWRRLLRTGREDRDVAVLMLARTDRALGDKLGLFLHAPTALRRTMIEAFAGTAAAPSDIRVPDVEPAVLAAAGRDDGALALLSIGVYGAPVERVRRLLSDPGGEPRALLLRSFGGDEAAITAALPFGDPRLAHAGRAATLAALSSALPPGTAAAFVQNIMGGRAEVRGGHSENRTTARLGEPASDAVRVA